MSVKAMIRGQWKNITESKSANIECPLYEDIEITLIKNSTFIFKRLMRELLKRNHEKNNTTTTTNLPTKENKKIKIMDK